MSLAGQRAGLWPEGCAVCVAMGEADVGGTWGNLLRALSNIPFLPVGRPQEPPKGPVSLLLSPRKSLLLLSPSQQPYKLPIGLPFRNLAPYKNLPQFPGEGSIWGISGGWGDHGQGRTV